MRTTAIMGMVLVVMSLVQPAHAWYDFGHESVATIAWNKLNPSTKDRVMTLLSKNPYYSKLLAQVPPGASDADKRRMIFAQSATWADVIKKDPAYHADDSEGGNKPVVPPAQRTSVILDCTNTGTTMISPFRLITAHCHHMQNRTPRRRSKLLEKS